MQTTPVPTEVIRTRRDIVIWAIAMLALLAFCLYDWNGYQVGTYGDDSSFVINAESLIRGVPYGMLLKPGENEPTQFPFVFPMMLVPMRLLFPNWVEATRIIPLFVTLAGLCVLFWGWRQIGKGLSYQWGTALVLLTALSPLTILHARTVMSEAPFMFFCILTIWWLEYVIAKSPRAWGIGLGLCFVGVVFTRTIGAAFIPFWLAYLIWHKRGTSITQLAVAALTVVGVLFLVTSTTTVQVSDLYPQEYLQQWNRVFNFDTPPPFTSAPSPQTAPPPSAGTPAPNQTLALDGLGHRLRLIFDHLDFATLLPLTQETALKEWTDQNHLSFVRFVPGLLVVALVTVGSIRWIRRAGISAFQLVVPPYLAIIMLWNWTPPRFFYPIQSQVFLASLFGIYAVSYFLVKRIAVRADAKQWAWRVIWVTTVCLLIPWSWLGLRAARLTSAESDVYARAAILREYLPANAVILDMFADVLYVDREFIGLPNRTASTAELAKYLSRHKVTHVVTYYGFVNPVLNPKEYGSTVKRFIDALQPLEQMNLLEPVYSNRASNVELYRLRTERLQEFQ